MANQLRRTDSTLLTASLLVTVLAIITGLLGMHVMTGSHSPDTSAMVSAGVPTTSGLAASTAGTEAAGHDVHIAASPDSAASHELSALNGAASPAQCPCPGNCSSQHSMSASCIPAPATGGLTIHAPDATVSITGTSTAWATAGYAPSSFRPSSPSPGDLSISRT